MRLNIAKILQGVAILVLAGSITALGNSVVKIEKIETRQDQYEKNITEIKTDLRDIRNFLIGTPKVKK